VQVLEADFRTPHGEPSDTASRRHDDKVARLRRDVSRLTGERPISIKKRTVSHQVPKARDLRRHDQVIDVRDLDEINERSEWSRGGSPPSGAERLKGT
jgi:hypothetical protein